MSKGSGIGPHLLRPGNNRGGTGRDGGESQGCEEKGEQKHAVETGNKGAEYLEVVFKGGLVCSCR